MDATSRNSALTVNAFQPSPLIEAITISDARKGAFKSSYQVVGNVVVPTKRPNHIGAFLIRIPIEFAYWGADSLLNIVTMCFSVPMVFSFWIGAICMVLAIFWQGMRMNAFKFALECWVLAFACFSLVALATGLRLVLHSHRRWRL